MHSCDPCFLIMIKINKFHVPTLKIYNPKTKYILKKIYEMNKESDEIINLV